jgi:3-phenylpropionate/trans-cinnamate dioxygenase ferredoxin reductase subunit
MPGTYVIVGASLAGAKAAQTLREEGFDGRVVLIGDDGHRPYERPPLSKGYLLGTEDESAAYVHDEGFYAENRIEQMLGTRVAAIDRAARTVTCEPGGEVAYDKLLLATGASPRRLNVPGGDDPGLFHLRTMDDSQRLRAAVSGGTARVVVVGAGWIGLECAAAARTYGCPVTIVEPEETPLYRTLGPEVGGVFADLHRRNGVDLRLGTGVTEIRRDGDAYTVVDSDGAELPADVVIVGVGARPNDDLARESGLETDNGVLVDSALRTADPDVYAAGDVANAYHPVLGGRLRVEHWDNALNSGPAAARAMLGQDVTYEPVPFFFSDQYDLGMEFAGIVTPGEYDEVVVRGGIEPGDDGSLEFLAFWVSRDRVIAGVNVNIWDVNEHIQALIRSAAPVDKPRLSDPEVALTDLT